MCSISSAQKENIIALASNGQSTRKIASSLGVSQPTVVRVLQNLLSNHQSSHSGRPSKLSATSERAIITQIITEKVANAVQATKHINSIIPNPVSSQTVRCVLKQHSLKAVTKKKKPLLSAVHCKKCLAFALKYQNWTVKDWKRVIWSDGKQWVLKQVGQGLIDCKVQGTVKFGGGNIMV
jgi:IS30 family transposase